MLVYIHMYTHTHTHTHTYIKVPWNIGEKRTEKKSQCKYGYEIKLYTELSMGLFMALRVTYAILLSRKTSRRIYF